MTGAVFENKWTPANIVQIGVLVVGLSGFGWTLKNGQDHQSQQLTELKAALALSSANTDNRIEKMTEKVNTLSLTVAVYGRRLDEVERDIDGVDRGTLQ